ncbi:DMT family transporter [Sneathiella litorea]|uniref:EamA family transporter n=1 Tax=Sneathiella litorea TaxID=2606216 RepID=A0A6L8WBC4_9PROT|nr:DMT family transporter [Sneathiella litorea]MZR31762.1 EamA family transporter [Sneathiella litorea]
MEAWIPITIFAAFFQNVRTALQKSLKGRLSTGGATYVRFLYGAPFALLYILAIDHFTELPVPTPNGEFALFISIGGLTQILATGLLVALFSLKNFAVGTTYSKTETVQAAIFGIVILGEHVGMGASLAIAVSFIGILLISMSSSAFTFHDFFSGWTSKAAGFGLLSGAFFGISAVCYRAAALSLGGEGAMMPAAFTLVCVLFFQTLVMTVYLPIREPGQLMTVVRNWRVAIWVGLTGMLGSVGWFTAMTLQNAAYVRALGQVELVFTFIASYFFFKERTNRIEAAGILLIVFGILLLLLD